MDTIRDAMNWLEIKRKASMSRAVVYSRGDSSLTVQATRARSQFDVDDGNGAFTRIETHDEIVAVADLIIDGIQATPKSGDRITDCDVVYEVHDAGNEPWRYTDSYRIAFRIHTKSVSSGN